MATTKTSSRCNVKRNFSTMAAAKAFAKGVEYVNDSSVEVVGIKKAGKGYVVCMNDRDAG